MISPGARIELMTRLPHFVGLDDYFPSLCRIVAQTSWLPHPDTVRAVRSAVFPTSRARKDRPRFTPILQEGEVVGIYDDNTTPTWALLWAHGIVGASRSGGHSRTSGQLQMTSTLTRILQIWRCCRSVLRALPKERPANGLSPVARMDYLRLETRPCRSTRDADRLWRP